MRGGDVDDTARPGLFHQRHGGGDGVERRGQVDGDDRVPLFRREILDRGDMLDAGIVDEHVHRAEAFGGGGDQRPAPVGFRHVGLDVNDLARMVLGHFGGECVILAVVGVGIQHNVEAVCGKSFGDGEADAGC